MSLDWGWVPEQIATPVLERARDQLQAYFDGELTAFDLPLAPAGTAYRRRSGRRCAKSPMAKPAAIRKSREGRRQRPIRRAGQRAQSDPADDPLSPGCCRDHIGGYSGGEGLPTKRWLLALENPTGTLF